MLKVVTETKCLVDNGLGSVYFRFRKYVITAFIETHHVIMAFKNAAISANNLVASICVLDCVATYGVSSI